MATPRRGIAAALSRQTMARSLTAALWSPPGRTPFVLSSPAAPVSAVRSACGRRAFHCTPQARQQPQTGKPPASLTPPPTGPTTPEASGAAADPAAAAAADSTPAPPAPQPAGPLANAPRSYGKRVEAFTPTPLSRPIGMPQPPQPGENAGVDTRTLRQRRDDFVDYDKHLVRRRELTSKIVKPYFRDWTNLQFHKGKTFVAPPRLFRADRALYFPNLVGQRLLAADRAAAADRLADTTPLLVRDTAAATAATVVAVFSGRWAENQVRSFVSAEANPALAAVLAAHRTKKDGLGTVQLMQINVEDNAMRAWLVRRFRGSLRRRVAAPADRERYLLVTRGLSDEIRECIGVLNSKVGYVYLVDRHGRIRWAGSGPSEPEERESLAKGVQRLLAEAAKEDSSGPAEPGPAGPAAAAAGSAASAR